jgi:hypothetical protein
MFKHSIGQSKEIKQNSVDLGDGSRTRFGARVSHAGESAPMPKVKIPCGPEKPSTGGKKG